MEEGGDVVLVRINGRTQTIAAETVTIAELLTLNQVASPVMVAVQLNGEFVELPAYETTLVRDNDEMELVYFLSGGR